MRRKRPGMRKGTMLLVYGSAAVLLYTFLARRSARPGQIAVQGSTPGLVSGFVRG